MRSEVRTSLVDLAFVQVKLEGQAEANERLRRMNEALQAQIARERRRHDEEQQRLRELCEQLLNGC